MNMRKNNFEERNDLAGEYRWGDIGQMILALFFIIGLFIDVFFLKIHYFSFQDSIPIYIKIFLFVTLMIISGYLVNSGLNLVFKQKRDRLVVIKSGVFSVVRHPVYLGSILLFFGFVILSFSILSFIFWIVIVLFYIFLSRYEEKLLIEKIGYDYEQYISEVPMFIPISKRGK